MAHFLEPPARVCRTEDGIVNRWLFVRYLVIGLYVGAVTCGGFAWWYTLAPVRARSIPQLSRSFKQIT